MAIARRRAVALAIVGGALVLVWLLFLRGGDESESPDPLAVISPQTATQVSEMSDEELADQVLLLGFDGTDDSAEFVDRLRKHAYGGVIVNQPNWIDAATGSALVAALRDAGRAGGRTPPLIVAQQEGGRYRAFADLPPELTELEIGDAGSTDKAREWARDGATALRAAGFDLDLFPVADVATIDSPLGDRAFSDDAAETAALTVAALQGCADAGLLCAAMHFPGLGAASEDTDHGPATVGLDAATLQSRDLVPFQQAFAAGMPAVVVSLGLYVAYDPVTPGALAEPVIGGLLRDQLDFRGLAITDDLGAGAVRANTPVPKAAVTALAAGADLVRIDEPSDQQGVVKAIVGAVEDGTLPRERLQQAAGRVLDLKGSRGLGAANP